MQIFTLCRAAFYLIKSITVRNLVLTLKSTKKRHRHAKHLHTGIRNTWPSIFLFIIKIFRLVTWRLIPGCGVSCDTVYDRNYFVANRVNYILPSSVSLITVNRATWNSLKHIRDPMKFHVSLYAIFLPASTFKINLCTGSTINRISIFVAVIRSKIPVYPARYATFIRLNRARRVYHEQQRSRYIEKGKSKK